MLMIVASVDRICDERNEIHSILKFLYQQKLFFDWLSSSGYLFQTGIIFFFLEQRLMCSRLLWEGINNNLLMLGSYAK